MIKGKEVSQDIFYFKREEVDLTIYEPAKGAKPIKDRKSGAMVYPYYKKMEPDWATTTDWRSRKYDE